ncbi:MAG: hypothetical protein M3Q23_10540 [Actinomycetota bacterium]|nr:hypothetical protein [Actinomycetota bacterium]
MADDDSKDRATDEEEESSDAEEEKVREAGEEGGSEERVEADFTSNDRQSSAFDPDKEGVAPPTGTPKPA